MYTPEQIPHIGAAFAVRRVLRLMVLLALRGFRRDAAPRPASRSSQKHSPRQGRLRTRALLSGRDLRQPHLFRRGHYVRSSRGRTRRDRGANEAEHRAADRAAAAPERSTRRSSCHCHEYRCQSEPSFHENHDHFEGCAIERRFVLGPWLSLRMYQVCVAAAFVLELVQGKQSHTESCAFFCKSGWVCRSITQQKKCVRGPMIDIPLQTC